MTAEQVLQEAIIDLQRQDLGGDMRRLVEEAAQLLADGRDIEARALVEKAQAITSRTYARSGAGPRVDPQELTAIERVAARLTHSVVNAFIEALSELQRDSAGQMKVMASALEERINERIEREAKSRAASIVTLEETDRAVSARVAAHEEQLAVLSRVVENLSPKVHSAIEQIDQHTALLQSIQERHAHRAAALNEVLDTIARLREPKPLANQAQAG